MITSVISDYEAIFNSYFEIGKGYNDKNLIESDKKALFDKELWDYFSDNGINGLSIGEQFGGKGLTALKSCVALEALSKGCRNNGMIFSSIAHLMAGAMVLELYGSDKQKQELLPVLCNGNRIAANCITETESGSDVYQMSTVAVKQGNHYRVNGEKTYITNAPVSNTLFVYAATDKNKGFFGGISCFVTPSDLKGIKISDPFQKMGLNSAQMGSVSFKDLDLSIDSLVAKEGSGGMIFAETMMWERVAVSAFLIGQLSRLLEQTINYSKKRQVAGRALMDMQSVRHTLADTFVVLEAGRNMVYDAAMAIDKKDKKTLYKTSATKLFVSENVVNAVKNLQSLHGAHGYLVDAELEREYRDAYASLLYSGTSNIQRNIISMGF